ncbi:NDH-dependent cyclic electron flow 5 [Wolffia australiana]
MANASLLPLTHLPLSAQPSPASTFPFSIHGATFPNSPSVSPANRPTITSNSPLGRPRRTNISCQAVSPLPRINVDYLEREFGGNGAQFRAIGDGCVVALRLEAGGTASIVLPAGLLSSYKPLMWHGSPVEVLHTTVSEAANRGAAICGGVSLDFWFARVGEESGGWSPRVWDLRCVTGSPESSIQVELVSCDPNGDAEMKHLVTFRQDLLASEFEITNRGGSHLTMEGSMVSHLKVSTPDAAYAVGLEGSSFHRCPPLGGSKAFIIPPAVTKGLAADDKKTLIANAVLGFFSGGRTRAEEDIDENEGEETDNYAQLTERMSRIYTTAPRVFTIIDRGRRNSVVVERRGFEEQYLFSPGSEHEYYDKYSYVSTGPSATLKPIVISPGGVWKGGQCLYNPNT